jgi:hypothetical protein
LLPGLNDLRGLKGGLSINYAPLLFKKNGSGYNSGKVGVLMRLYQKVPGGFWLKSSFLTPQTVSQTALMAS